MIATHRESSMATKMAGPIKIKKPGQLHRDLGVPAGQKIPEAKLKAAEKKPGKVGMRARAAETMKGFKHG